MEESWRHWAVQERIGSLRNVVIEQNFFERDNQNQHISGFRVRESQKYSFEHICVPA